MDLDPSDDAALPSVPVSGAQDPSVLARLASEVYVQFMFDKKVASRFGPLDLDGSFHP